MSVSRAPRAPLRFFLRRRASAVVVGVVTALVVGVAIGAPLAAETPSAVADEVADDGVYVAPGRQAEIDETELAQVVVDASERGIRLVLVAPDEAVPTTQAFARRVREQTEVDVALVFGPDGAIGANVFEDFEDGELRAINAARTRVSPRAQASAYVRALVTEPVRERPAVIDDLIRWVVYFVIVLIGAALLEQIVRYLKRARRRTVARRSAAAEAGITDAGIRADRPVGSPRTG